MRFITSCFLSIAVCFYGNAQLDQNRLRNAVDELKDFLAIPNFGLNKVDIEKNIEWLDKAFEKRKFSTQVLETIGNQLFFAELSVDEELPTVLFYMHLDGQAVDASKWDQADPYQLVLKAMNAAGEWEKLNWEKCNLHGTENGACLAAPLLMTKAPSSRFCKP